MAKFNGLTFSPKVSELILSFEFGPSMAYDGYRFQFMFKFGARLEATVPMIHLSEHPSGDEIIDYCLMAGTWDSGALYHEKEFLTLSSLVTTNVSSGSGSPDNWKPLVGGPLNGDLRFWPGYGPLTIVSTPTVSLTGFYSQKISKEEAYTSTYNVIAMGFMLYTGAKIEVPVLLHQSVPSIEAPRMFELVISEFLHVRCLPKVSLIYKEME